MLHDRARSKLEDITCRRLIPLATALLVAANAAAAERTILNFDPDWRVVKDDPGTANMYVVFVGAAR